MTSWSMKKDRDLIQLAKAKLSADPIAERLKISPQQVRKVAKKLGFYFSRLRPSKAAG
jgi:predicted ArsR family transcriptional regulator